MPSSYSKEDSLARKAARKLLNQGETLGGSRRSGDSITISVKKGNDIVAYIDVDFQNKAERRQPAYTPGIAHNKGKKNRPKKK